VGKGPGIIAMFKSIPQIGAKKLYRGIIPAVFGGAVNVETRVKSV